MARRRTLAAKPAAAKTVILRFAQATQRAALIASVSLLGLAASGVLGLRVATAQEAAQTLPGAQILPGGRWTGARLPTVAQTNNGLVMTIKQEQKAALLDWSQFDVGASEEVIFDQGGADWIALNRIFNANPTQIAGKITAKGQVWLANTNGVVFKGTAKVNTQSILVTTTGMPDNILDVGLMGGHPREGGMWGDISGLLYGAKGDVIIESGAKLTLKSSDPTINSKAIFLGVNVVNNGEIDVTDGQALLMAGEQFVFRNSSEQLDFSYVRGAWGLTSTIFPEFGRYRSEAAYDKFMVDRAAEIGMRVVNNGVIRSTRGNVFLHGAEIQQNGTILSTTGVRQRSGSIVMRAGFGFDDAELNYSGTFDHNAGKIVLGKGSLTQVSPEVGTDASPALETFTGASRSRITLTAASIAMKEDSVLRATSGLVTIDANVSAQPGADFAGSQSGQPGEFSMARGALIDVSGKRDVKFDVKDNIVDVEVRSNELSGAPKQRDGILYGEDVKVDIRRGASIVDWTGALANRNQTAEQRSINGGEVQIRALRSVRIDDGAKIDISGGSANYAGGMIAYTQLTAADGRVYDLADADPNQAYVGLSKGTRYDAGYSEGGDAGKLEILSSSQVLFGRVISNVHNGERQIAGGLKGLRPLTPTGANEGVPTTRLAKGGEVQISTASESLTEYFVDQVFVTAGQGPVTLTVEGGQQVVLDPSKIDARGYLEDGYTQVVVGFGRPGDPKFRLAPGWVLVDGKPAELRAALVARGFEGDALEALLEPDATLPTGFLRGEARRFSFIEDDFASGVQTLSFNDKADAGAHYWNIQSGANLGVKPGGLLNLGVTPADVGSSVILKAAGGVINANIARIGAGSKLSVAGQWTNDLDSGGQFGGYVDGGKLQLLGALLDGDVTLDASGGGWWKRASPDTASSIGGFELVNGKGGSIVAVRNELQSGTEYLDRADFKLGGLGGFGALDLQNLGDIVIGPDGGSAPAGAVYLSNSRLNGWGVGSLSLGGGLFSLPVGGALVGRVAYAEVINPDVADSTSPDYYIVRTGEVITPEKVAKIAEVNAAIAEYNASKPEWEAARVPIATVVVAATVDVRDGARLDLKRQAWTLTRPASAIATGADLSLSAKAILPPEHLRGTVSFALGSAGFLNVADDAVIKVDPLGSVSLNAGYLDLAGDVIAHGGKIDITGGSQGGWSKAVIRSTALLDASGVAQTRRVQGAAPGETWIDGKILAGGAINVATGGDLVVEKGAMFDVSGAAGTLTVSAPSRFGAVRVDRLVGSDAGQITVSAGQGYLLGDMRGQAGTPNARAGILTLSGGAIGKGPNAVELAEIIERIAQGANEYSQYGFATLQDLAVGWYGYAPESIEPIPIDDPVALRAFLVSMFASAGDTDINGYLALDPTLETVPSSTPTTSGFTPGRPEGYVPQTGEAGYLTAVKFLVDTFSWVQYASTFGNMSPGTTFHVGKAALAAAGNFETVSIGGTQGAVRVDSDLTLKAQGALNLTPIMAATANVTVEAQTISFVGGGPIASGGVSTGGVFTANAQTINVEGASFDGFSKVTLNAERSLSGGSNIIKDQNGKESYASIYAPGELTIRAGQIYPYTGKILGIFSDTSVTVRGTGKGGAAPLSAGGKLVIEAPTINQGGVLAAPFGAIEFKGKNVNFLPGSLTMVSADGRTVLYGHTVDGSNWYGPTPGGVEDVLLSTPPEKRITITGDKVDLQAGAVIDASGGGDVLGLEFVQGPQGGVNILSGAGVFAISTALGADVSLGQAPSTAPRGDLAVGDVVWLPAFDGNPAGYYTLLPAEYALTPGGYRITAAQAGAGSTTARATGDGGFVLAGYQAGEQGRAFTDQNFTTFNLFSGQEVRQRSEFIETSGNTFFSSELFLTGLKRSGGVFNANPRLPIDGGFMTIAARESLQLNGTFSAGGANRNSRGGVLDIAGDRIVVASANTDISDLAGYLRLDPKQLSGVAESLLIGGVRRQGAGGLEIVTGYEGRDENGPLGSTIGAERIVVRNGAGDALTGPEILFAATDEIRFEAGSVVRAVGDGFQAPDVLIRPELPAARVLVNGSPVDFKAEDRGAFVRVSNLGDVSITRASPLTDRGDITVEAGARLEATDAVALNATRNTTLEPGAIIKAGAIEAAAGSVSFGDAPAATNGLVLTKAAFDALSTAQVLRLRSLTNFELYGDVRLTAANNLVLDGGGVVDMDGAGASGFSAKTLVLTNTLGAVHAPTANNASLTLSGETVIRDVGSMGLSFGSVIVDAKGRMLFAGAGATDTLGDLTIRATEITAAGGAAQDVKAGGRLDLLSQVAPVSLTRLETAGSSLDFFGRTVNIDLPIALASGVLRATATDDLTVGAKGRINASGSAIAFFDKTEYLTAGAIGLSSENGDVIVDSGAVLDVSGGAGGGDAGSIVLSASRGVAQLDGTLKGSATPGFRGGQFSLGTSTLGNFGALNAKLNDSGFSRLRRFSIADGDALIDGVTRVETFELSTGSGSVTMASGAQIITTGAKGGKILIASGGDLTINDGALLDASANAANQRGGDISLQVGDSGAMTIGAAILDVSATGTGQAGEARLRARQVGNDVAVVRYGATVLGGVTQLEAYRVTDLGSGDGIINTALQTQVANQAAAYMAAASGNIRTRLGQADGARFVISPGIEIRAGGDLTLVDNWNLKDARYNGAAGVLTLRAGGDLNIDNANLSDGFIDAVRTPEFHAPIELNVPNLPGTLPTVPNKLTNDTSWSYNLVAGADFSQTNVLSTLVSTSGKGDIRLDGMVRTGTGDINVAASGDLIYADPDVWSVGIETNGGGPDGNFPRMVVTGPDGAVFTFDAPDDVNSNYAYEVNIPGLGQAWLRPGDRTLVLADGRVLQNDGRGGLQPPTKFNVNNASIYTAGVDAPAVADFDTPIGFAASIGSGRPEAYYFKPNYTHRGGDVTVNVGGSILAVDNPSGTYDYSWWQGAISPGGQPGTAAYAALDRPFAQGQFGQLNQTNTSILFDAFRQSMGALGGGDVTIAAGGDAVNMSVSLPTSIRVSGGRVLGDAKTVHVDGGGDLQMSSGGDIEGGWFYVAKGTSDIRADGSIGAGPAAVDFVIDDAKLKVQAGGDLRIGQIYTASMAYRGDSYRPQDSWVGYTQNTAAELISLGGDLTYRGLRLKTPNDYALLPSDIRFVTPNGSVNFGDESRLMMKTFVDQYPSGRVEVLARDNITFYAGTNQGFDFTIGWDSPERVGRVLNPFAPTSSEFFPGNAYAVGGAGYSTGGGPNVRAGRSEFSAFYALEGDIVSLWPTGGDDGGVRYNTGSFLFGHETRLKAGGDIRMGAMAFFNQDADDVSMVQAGGSIYLPDISAYGTGHLWVQSGDEIFMGNTAGRGIRAVEMIDSDPLTNIVNGVDVHVLTGIDQTPEYQAFFDLYLDPKDLASKASYLSEYYTFDALNLGTPHATTLADGVTETTIYAVDLVNYWNEMHGRPPLSLEGADGRPLTRGALVSKISKADYDAAAAWFKTLDPVKKQPLATRILFAELKVGGREAVGSSSQTDPSFTRSGDPTRGYAAIGKLFPGAQRKPGEARAAGEARWFGDLIMNNSQIRTDGGGDLEILSPGGMVQLASLGVTNTSPNASGVLTQDKGSVYALTYGDYIVNQSRTMTADDGDILIWSSFGNIDAGKGRKSSLSIPPIIFPIDTNFITKVVRSGLPNGAGIATLNQVDGSPGGDVDLYAFNGVVNAGDAGIRASRDLFVGALEIRGLDNITVGGMTNVELNTEEAELGPINLENFAQAAEDDAIAKAFDMSAEVEKLRTVSQTILTGSVVSFGEDPDQEKTKK